MTTDLTQIILSDGTLLPALTKEEVVAGRDDYFMRPDAKATYCQLEKKDWPCASSQSYQEAARFFYEHAFFFLDHAKEILADSRMFLAPVPVCNGLALCSALGLANPTLGEYIEWWQTCPNATIFEDGEKWLVWRFGGVSFNGCNICEAVNRNGEVRKVKVHPFAELFKPYLKICARYNDARLSMAAYTLPEVYALLKGEPVGKWFEDTMYLRSLAQLLSKSLEVSKGRECQLQGEITSLRIQLHQDAARELYDNFVAESDRIHERLENLKEQRRFLRRRLKNGDIDTTIYQQAYRPIKREMENTEYPPLRKYDVRIRELGWQVTMNDIINFFNPKQ